MSAAKVRAQYAAAELKQAKDANAKVPGTVSRTDIDQRASNEKEAQAAVLAAEANVNLAKLNLDSTKIRAAIGGVISRPQLSVGNLVTAGTQTLATIVCADPMYVVFDIDERSVLDLRRRAIAENAKTGREFPIEVRCAAATEKDFRRGTMESKDERMDPATGAARWRATLPNPDGVLMPGMFARVRLLIGWPHKALLVPEQALGADQGRRCVFVIDKKNTVERRDVETGHLEGELREVKTGLTADDWVVSSGLQAISAGRIVKPKTPPGSPPSSPHDFMPPSAPSPKQGPKQESPASSPPAFRTATVRRGDLAVIVASTAGEVNHGEVKEVTAEVSGQIVEMGDDPRGKTDPSYKGKPIDYGTPVEEGTILAKIDDTAFRARLKEAEAAVARAKAQLAAATGKAVQTTSDSARVTVAALKAAEVKSVSDMKQAQKELDSTVIRSPIKGIVVACRVNVGYTVAGGPRGLVAVAGQRRSFVRPKPLRNRQG